MRQRIQQTLVCVTISLAGSACDSGIPSQGEILHPMDEYLPNVRDLPDMSSARREELEQLGTRFEHLDTIFHVGSITQSDGEVIIGLISDMAFSETGVLVLDSRTPQVLEFDFVGVELGSFGGKGSGPSEFSTPLAIAADGDSVIWVADPRHGVKKFVRGSGIAGPELAKAARPPTSPEDMCLSGDDVVVQGWSSSGGTVHIYDEGADEWSSFGHEYGSPNWLVRDQLSEGILGCPTTPSGIVAIAFKAWPEIYGYSRNGELVWRADLPKFEGQVFREFIDNLGRNAVGVKNDAWDQLIGMVHVAEGALLVQFARFARRTGPSGSPFIDVTDIRSVLVDEVSGGVVVLTATLPQIFDASTDHILAATNDPYPQAFLLRYR